MEVNIKLFNIGCALIYLQIQDAHSIVPNFDQNSSLFGVYDGHGGKYCRHSEGAHSFAYSSVPPTCMKSCNMSN